MCCHGSLESTKLQSGDAMIRRDFLRNTSAGFASALLPATTVYAQQTASPSKSAQHSFNVRDFGAMGDGATIDTPAINRTIDAAAGAGGGNVIFPAGQYLCYTIRLKSHISLQLEAGAIIVAAEVPKEGTPSGGYDPAGPPQPWEAYQDFGHNHWPNSLIYGESLEGVSIYGPGLIWGKGLSRGERDELPRAESPGVGNKAIALKNCRNVVLRDLSILMGGHFAVLLTGTDNVVIDGLTIDTNRDGIDIDCCRNVRVANCVVNSPWDDAICPKSSFALGYARPTENVTITNCYVTGIYEFGSLLSGKFVQKNYSDVRKSVGRIKCGTESNGGFKKITITNCILEGCRGFALETVDGGIIEDITVSNITMRGVIHSPLFLRLGKRMRGPKGVKPGYIQRILFSNIVSSGAVAQYPSILAGESDAPIEDIKFDNLYLEQLGGGTEEWAALQPPEKPDGYPEADMFGTLPASGFFLRHARNIELSNVEIAAIETDARPAIWAEDVDGLDVFRLRAPRNAPGFSLRNVRGFRSFGSRNLPDRTEALIDQLRF
jgi:polygalacturonase